MASVGPNSDLSECQGRLAGRRNCSLKTAPARIVLRRGRPACENRRLTVTSSCLYQTSQQEHQHREPLSERRSALALGCTDRPAATWDIIPNIPSKSAAGSPRLRIAVDVDEVLGRFVHALNQFCEEQYGMAYDVGDYWVYEFAKIWNCTQDRSNSIVHEFFNSSHFSQGIPVIPGAYDALNRLSRSGCELVVVTSRQHVIQDITLDWIDRHYPNLFEEVYFGNHFAMSGISRKKSDICRQIGADVLIDDNPTYAYDCAQHGINVLLYDWEGAYPWSKLPDGMDHPNIQVVRDWTEAEAALKAMMHTARR